MRQRIDAFPRAGEIQMPCHGPWRDDAADASGHGGAEAIEGVFENDGFIGCDTEIFGGMEEEAGVGLHLAGVIDGGNMMKMITQAELVHPRVDPHSRAAAGDGDAQSE